MPSAYPIAHAFWRRAERIRELRFVQVVGDSPRFQVMHWRIMGESPPCVKGAGRAGLEPACGLEPATPIHRALWGDHNSALPSAPPPVLKVVPEAGLEPAPLAGADFKSAASTVPPLRHCSGGGSIQPPSG